MVEWVLIIATNSAIVSQYVYPSEKSCLQMRDRFLTVMRRHNEARMRAALKNLQRTQRDPINAISQTLHTGPSKTTLSCIKGHVVEAIKGQG